MSEIMMQKLGFQSAATASCAEISGGYCGDLLSHVLAHAGEGCLWFTVIGNSNTVAVAKAVRAAAVVLCDGIKPDAEMLRCAAEQGVSLYTTDLSSFEAAKRYAVAAESGQ